jgi:nucleoside-diphosphate-sugar epimerase
MHTQAFPQDAYGWEKLISERLCTHYREELGVETKMCAFIISFVDVAVGRRTGKGSCSPVPKGCGCETDGNHEIGNMGGDGEQTRSFCYIDELYRRDLSADAVRLLRASKPRSGQDGNYQ